MELSKVKLIVLDFDGVLTNNKVLLNDQGEEFVSCSRADGLAFDALRILKVQTIILSTEKNKVVSSRAKKLQVECFQGIKNKKDKLIELIKKYKLNKSEVLFVGNDINDISAMSLCELTFCPSDSHEAVKNIAKVVLRTKGGEGVVREILETHFKLDLFKLLYT
jgi:3-deoxy-D-manno-octulosonate 8-phosphate phosphatase (KDO 8-P phosphatase)